MREPAASGGAKLCQIHHCNSYVLPMPDYRDLLDSLRQAFPQPVSNPVHDAYFVFSILRALDQVDALKSQAPILGTPCQPDYEAARRSRVEQHGKPLEQVIPEL